MSWLRRLRRLRCLLRICRLLPPLLRHGAFRLRDKVEDLIGRARFIDPANSCVCASAVRPRRTISGQIKKCWRADDVSRGTIVRA
jgi:hypothetical protein